MRRLFLWLIPLLALPLALPARAADRKPSPREIQFFETRVRPVLAENCYKCHAGTKHRGGLRLDSRAGLLTGGDQGAALVPGRPDRSLLIKAVRQTDDSLKMPPKKKLPDRQVADLALWVKMGAPWPGSSTATPVRSSEVEITAQDRAHWSFRPVQRPSVPVVRDRAWPANPVDAFVLAKLEAKGLKPSPPASRRELIRRAYFDLIGLPPTPEEVEAFVNDKSPHAWEDVIDRLLARPEYGERWGRHWLDVVRFAQTNGYERDDEKPYAWRYRDYVIKAFNEDKPYDRFVKEQLAGDELSPASDEALTATAFYRLGVWDDEPDDKRQAEFDDLDDILATTGESFLGLTLGCARCHDHKFDPIPQEDYYSMLAFLRNIKPMRSGRDAAQFVFVRLSSGQQALAVREFGPSSPPTHVLARGNAAMPGKLVEPRFLRVLCRSDEAVRVNLPRPGPAAQTTGRRRALAEWIASRDNPLTARVIVNRLWQHHFGRGLVATPNDFGRSGVRPSHPELLDWLAAELMDGGWRLKRIQKTIMLSSVYRQSSRSADEKAARLDPDNTLLWRQNLRRLEAEAIRDSVLAISGRLNLKMGGRGIFPTLPPEVLATQSRPGNGWDKSSPVEQGRRSVYVFVKRTLGVPLLDTFDFASPDKPVAARTATTIAPQALILLNSAFMEEQAGLFADRLLREGGTQPEKNVERAFRLALGRGPTERERLIALAYLQRVQKAHAGGSYRDALARLCKVVLNLNEFVYID